MLATGNADVTSAASLAPLTLGGRIRHAAEILRVYVAVRWHLRRSDLTATVAALRAAAPQGEQLELELRPQAVGARLANATRRTLAILPADSRCLMQSLVLLGLLSRRGIGSVLVIAVKPAGGFRAHAWVELNGSPLLPSGEYERLVEI